MAFHRLKAGTKDIDVILHTEAEADALIAALREKDYTPPGRQEPVYVGMGARQVLENADTFRWDVFVQSVKGFEFSPRMAARCQPWLRLERIEALMLTREDIFTFKALTDRPRDREDMHLLFLAGLDFQAIRQEVFEQARKPGGKRFALFFHEGLVELVQGFGITYPGVEEFEQLAFVERLAVTIGGMLERGPLDAAGLRRLKEAHDLSDEELREAVDKLVAWGIAREEDGVLKQRLA